ncbi:MAG: patatin-like phospholipase family protein [Synechococcaceae cyanobacterium]
MTQATPPSTCPPPAEPRGARAVAEELSRYLIALRVPLLLLGLAVAAFLSQQISDVLLAMALEPEWGAYGLACLTAALFGTALWFAARSLSDLNWMGPPPSSAEPGEASPVASPKVSAMPAGVVWWLPRALGIVPALLMAGALLVRVGGIGMGRRMVAGLVVEAGVLLWLFYARTRLVVWRQDHRRLLRRIPLTTFSLGLVERLGLTVTSGNRIGLFSARAELLLMAAAWMVLALISVPIARAAHGPMAGGSLHLYVILIVGAAVLALDWCLDPDPGDSNPAQQQYWSSFVLLLLLALLLPLLITVSGLSAVAIPRYLGSIAILYASLAIFTVFASSLFLVGRKTGVPLVSLLLIGALLLASFRVNDNHAVRLLPPAGQPPLPPLETSLAEWLNQKGRREAIEAQRGASKWPLYVVSAQGGGVFAAYHAAKALALISEALPAFPDHLFAISGVSGGSVGATLYANALQQASSGRDLVERIDSTFEQDQLSPVLAAMLFPDAAQRFYPVPVPAWDRALGLELAFSDGGSRAPAPVSLEGSFYTGQQGPFLVLNTTEVQSGRRHLLAPFQFESDASFHEPSRGDIRFSTAAVMSARFPLITPYAFFPGSPQERQRRTVDGGYYDNSGAVTAAEIVRSLTDALPRLGLADKVEVLPIAIAGISNFPLGDDPQLPAEDPPSPRSTPSAWPRPLTNVSAVQALFAARDARVGQALREYGVRCGKQNSSSAATDRGSRSNLCITLQTRVLLKTPDTATPKPLTIPLGWSLSCQARSVISEQLAIAGNERPPCLAHQGTEVLLETAMPKAGRVPGIPSFAEILATLRSQVDQSAARGRYP